jgi:hypothetical protein
MANETKLSSIINPEVLANMVESKLVNAMKFTPLCRVDNTLVGQPGNTVTLPQFAYIGDAADIGELGTYNNAELTATTQQVTIKKIGKAVSISDEAILSGYGDPVGEIGKQLTVAIASKVDGDVLAALDNATLIHPVVTVTPNEINNALVKLGEDFEGDKYLFVGAATYAALRDSADWLPASEVAANLVIAGTVGMIYGCIVVITNKITTTNTAYIVKPGAVALFMKRGVSIETFREKNDATTFHANKHFAPYLYDSSKVVKLGAATLTTLEVKQDASISGGKASFTVTGYPTNVSYGWKAYAATNLDAAVSVTVGTDFENGSGEDHAAFAAEYVAGFKYAATNGKYFQVIYVDAAGKIRGTGNVAIATTVA